MKISLLQRQLALNAKTINELTDGLGFYYADLIDKPDYLRMKKEIARYAELQRELKAEIGFIVSRNWLNRIGEESK